MKTKEFLELLTKNPNHALNFEYEAGKFVPITYHITEVKNVHIKSVDCGGRPDSYDQTIVQLWVDPNEKKDRSMTTTTALKIFNIVDSKTPMKQDTPLFFEWGHGALRTSVYSVESIEQTDQQITVKMFVPATVCKPKYELEMSGSNSCGPGCC